MVDRRSKISLLDTDTLAVSLAAANNQTKSEFIRNLIRKAAQETEENVEYSGNNKKETAAPEGTKEVQREAGELIRKATDEKNLNAAIVKIDRIQLEEFNFRRHFVNYVDEIENAWNCGRNWVLKMHKVDKDAIVKAAKLDNKAIKISTNIVKVSTIPETPPTGLEALLKGGK